MRKDKERFDVYQAVADQIVAALEAARDKGGHIPWRKPWTGGDGVQINAKTRKPYRGINQILLSMSPFGTPYWMTMRQANEADGKVRKGEHSTLVVFWKHSRYAAKSGDEGAKIDPNTGRWIRESFLLRYYRVFNVAQIEGLPDGFIPEPDDAERTPHERDERCESVLRGYVEEQSIRFTEAGARAFYAPALDSITVPELAHFESPEAFYSTALHECVHSTGHPDRLNRQGVADFDGFGSDRYGKEELVAEVGASMLAALLQIDTAPLNENRDAYINSWLTTIRGEPKLVVQAAAQAQKAADMIVGDRWAELVEVTPFEDTPAEEVSAAA